MTALAGPAAPARAEARALIGVVFLTALAGILYELLLGTVSSLLLGDSVLEWSLTIGIFLSAMGLGSWLSRFAREDLAGRLVAVQVGLALLGGLAPLLLFTVYAFAEDALRGVLVLVLVALGTGVGLEIPLLTRLLRAHGTLAEALSSALAFDYVGALVASLAFPLLLYPTIGLARTALLAGALNVAAGAILVRALPAAGGKWRRVTALAAVGLVLLAGVALATRLVHIVDKRIYGGEVVWAEVTPYQGLALTMEPRTQDLRLYINRNLQFSSRDERRYHEALVHPVMSAARSHARVLVLGGGDGLAVREVLRWPDVERVDLVDLDARMTELASTFAPLARLNARSLSDARVHVVHADAMRWIHDARSRHDVVIVDLPDPSTPGLARLYSTEFYRLAAQRLAPGGALVTQATSPYYTREAFWCIERSVAAAGLATRPYHISVPSFGEWGFVLAAHDAPAVARPAVATSYLGPEQLAALFVFPPDMARVDVHESSLFEPALSSYYAEAMRREQ